MSTGELHVRRYGAMANVVLFLFVIFWAVGGVCAVFIPAYVPVVLMFSGLVLIGTRRSFVSRDACVLILLVFALLASMAGGVGALKIALLGLLLLAFLNWAAYLRRQLGPYKLVRTVSWAGELAIWITPFAFVAELVFVKHGWAFPIVHDHESQFAGLFGEPSHIGMTLGPWLVARCVIGRKFWRLGMLTDVVALLVYCLIPSTTLLLSVILGVLIRCMPRLFALGYLVLVPILVICAYVLNSYDGVAVRGWIRNGAAEGSWDILISHILHAGRCLHDHPLGVGLFQYGDTVPEVVANSEVDHMLKYSGTDGSSIFPYAVVTMGWLFVVPHWFLFRMLSRITSTRGLLDACAIMWIGAMLLSFSRWAGPIMGSALALGAFSLVLHKGQFPGFQCGIARKR